MVVGNSMENKKNRGQGPPGFTPIPHFLPLFMVALSMVALFMVALLALEMRMPPWEFKYVCRVN